jgi:hypothetical protein
MTVLSWFTGNLDQRTCSLIDPHFFLFSTGATVYFMKIADVLCCLTMFIKLTRVVLLILIGTNHTNLSIKRYILTKIKVGQKWYQSLALSLL